MFPLLWGTVVEGVTSSRSLKGWSLTNARDAPDVTKPNLPRTEGGTFHKIFDLMIAREAILMYHLFTHVHNDEYTLLLPAVYSIVG